jgi:uncharacterized protein YbjT (DUF2867 family)
VSILVAGGTGFIGSAVVRRLVHDGADVVVMTAHPKKRLSRIGRMGVRAVRGDVQDAQSLADAARGAEVVVQALTFPTYPAEKPSKGFTFEEFDHHGTERMVRASRQAGVRMFVYISGAGAAPDADKTWHRAKWGGEVAVRNSGIEHVILRPSWAYGPGDRALNRLLAFPRWLAFVPVVGDGSQRLQPVLIDDVAAAVARAVRPDGPRGTFEIGGPEVLSMNEVVRTALDVMGKKAPLVHFPVWMPKLAGWFLQALPRPPFSPDAVDLLTGDALADTGSLVEAFGIRLTPFREGLGTYLRR